ncbi:hypothetical protein H0H92_007826 [Tricholoma furcatifolium]|nr:hypothetical protein H0H92_007826 [Tricholoma furcatifolium]
MRKRLTKKQLLSGPPPTPSYTPSAGPSRPRVNVVKKKKLPALVFVSHGQSLLQNHYLPSRPSSRPEPDRPPSPILDAAIDNPFLDLPAPSRNRSKKEKQWERWRTLLPSMVSHYMAFLGTAGSNRDPGDYACTCGVSGRSIEIIVVRFDYLEKISITLCSCAPAPIQLLQWGCFASAPLEPTLAVDLKVLDFVSSLFLNIAPNHTAWCKTVEGFLEERGYKLGTEGSLRKRFSNALLWYNALQDTTAQYVDNELSRARQSTMQLNDGIEPEYDDEFDRPEPFSSPCLRGQELLDDDDIDSGPVTPPRRNNKRGRAEDDDEIDEADNEANPFPDPRHRVRPSDYLRSRCPLCFGGEFPQDRESHNGEYVAF